MAQLSLFLLGLMIFIGSMASAPASRPKRMVSDTPVPDVLDSVVQLTVFQSDSFKIDNCSGTWVRLTNATHGWILTSASCCDPEYQVPIVVTSRKGFLKVSANCIHNTEPVPESDRPVSIALIEVTGVLDPNGTVDLTTLFKTLPMDFERVLDCDEQGSVYGYGSDSWGQVPVLKSLQIERIHCNDSDEYSLVGKGTAGKGDPMIFGAKILGVIDHDDNPESDQFLVELHDVKDFIESTLDDGLESTIEPGTTEAVIEVSTTPKMEDEFSKWNSIE